MARFSTLFLALFFNLHLLFLASRANAVIDRFPRSNVSKHAAAVQNQSGSTDSSAVYYISPAGNDEAAGSIEAPFKTITKANAVVRPGDSVFLRGDHYSFDTPNRPCKGITDSVAAVVLNKAGKSPEQPIRYLNYPNEVPVLDFSGMSGVHCRVMGVQVRADYIHLRGLEITGVPQQRDIHTNRESWGVFVMASNGVFEQLNLHHNMGPGLLIYSGSHNLVLNCDSHDNFDPFSANGPGQNADGFGVHVGPNMPGNVFQGCRAWSNSDDGFDLINAYSSVTIDSCWSWGQGPSGQSRKFGFASDDDDQQQQHIGNGFKVGGYGGRYVANVARHTIQRCVAFDNRDAGFYANHHPIANDYFNNLAFGNGHDFDMTSSVQAGRHGATTTLGKLRNNVSLSPSKELRIDGGADSSHNSWDLALSLDPVVDFIATADRGWDAPREADGSLPELKYYHLKKGSTLIDAGIDVGLSFHGKAPDLGPFEWWP